METKTKNSRNNATKIESTDFRNFFIDQLKDVYWAEKALYKSLPRLRDAATNERLAEAFDNHINETREQIVMVEEVFNMLGEKPQTKKCDAMEGLIKEADSIVEDTTHESYTRDAALIMAAQKAEHYEIACYGTLSVLALHMGETEVAEMLQRVLTEEKQTDVNLTILAEECINECAAQE